MEENAEPSVWYVAGVAICVLTAFIMIMGGFSGT